MRALLFLAFVLAVIGVFCAVRAATPAPHHRAGLMLAFEIDAARVAIKERT
jgi:hypothetical protein